MGYAGRMLAKHDPWLYFGLWVIMLVLFNFFNSEQHFKSYYPFIDKLTHSIHKYCMLWDSAFFKLPKLH